MSQSTIYLSRRGYFEPADETTERVIHEQRAIHGIEFGYYQFRGTRYFAIRADSRDVWYTVRAYFPLLAEYEKYLSSLEEEE